MLIGVVSDTHGSLHPRLVPILRESGVELILHAGDVGNVSILSTLGEVALVHAVRGNVDHSPGIGDLPVQVRLELGGVHLFMTHVGGKPASWLPALPLPRPDIAICGHSHMPLTEQFGGVLFLNPGAAGTQPRFGTPLSAAILRIEQGGAKAELIQL